MVTALARTTASNCTNPVLIHLAYDKGFLRDPVQLEFQIFDISTPQKRIAPVQVFPGAGRQAVDLTDCASGGDRLGLGRFVADYTPVIGEELGDHLIKWFMVLTTGASELTFEQEFLVVAETEPVLPNALCTIQELRDEGLTVTEGSDKRVLKALIRASKFIERVTGRFFGPKFIEQRVNGRQSPMVFFGDPIIAIEQVEVNSFPFDPEPDFIFSEDSLRVYNRHVANGLLNPDDRDNPKIEIFRGPRNLHLSSGFNHHRFIDFLSLEFPKGQQNINVKGVFGYTDPDGSSTGSVPEEIRRVCALLTLREIPDLSEPDRSFENQAFRITQERTRQQSIRFASPSGRAQSMIYGFFTGDPEIDAVLAAYMRPPSIGVV